VKAFFAKNPTAETVLYFALWCVPPPPPPYPPSSPHHRKHATSQRTLPSPSCHTQSYYPHKMKIGIFFPVQSTPSCLPHDLTKTSPSRVGCSRRRYYLNIQFNIINKQIYNYFPFPWFVSAVHLAVGLLIMTFFWQGAAHPVLTASSPRPRRKPQIILPKERHKQNSPF
jgi:hypothetical protein